MKSVKQEDNLGCSIACTAFICKVNYKTAKKKYFIGLGDANKTGYSCRDIVKALNRSGKNFGYKYIKKRKKFKKNTIVFIKRSKKYPAGHFLAWSGKFWMDPWINFDISNPNLKKAKSGFRKKLPGKAIYEIFPIKDITKN